MTDEPKDKDDTEAKQPAEDKTQPKKSGFAKYVLYGVAGIVLVAVAAFATLMITGDDQSQSTDASEETATAETYDKNANLDGTDSLAADDLDPSVIETIMENLAVLDYEPDPSEVEGAEVGMSVEDSLEAVNWLEKEKAALAKKEKELNSRQKELELLDKKVTQKVLRIEQAESARIANLAKLYDGMDARAVAKLMANLDDETVVSILPRMKIKNASAVLQLLPPRRAAKLSKQMITIAEK